MEVIGIRELRQNASQYLVRVEAGEEFAVTNRGRLVARLIPIEAAARSREALIESGALIPARQPGNLLATTPAPPSHRTRSLSAILTAMREE